MRNRQKEDAMTDVEPDEDIDDDSDNQRVDGDLIRDPTLFEEED